jgi:hypothetical protein
MAGNYYVGYLPEGQTWFSGDNVVGGKNLFVCVGLCGSVANIIFPPMSFDLVKINFSVSSVPLG